MTKFMEVVGNGWGRIISVMSIIVAIAISHNNVKSDIKYLRKDFEKHECLSQKLTDEFRLTVKEIRHDLWIHIGRDKDYANPRI